MSVRRGDEDFTEERRRSLVEEDQADHAEREEDEADDDVEFIRAKWTMDGASSLEEAALRLEHEAARLRRLAADGWRLDGEVDNDYGRLTR